MVRTPSIDKNGIKRGAWSEDEDNKLRAYVERFGHPNWRQLPKYAGLMRCGKSCRLRWMNNLRPGLKKGNYSHEEEELIIKLHKELGTRWSTIAERLPGRSDNDVKNHWHAHLKKRERLTNANYSSTSTEKFSTDESSQSESSQNEPSHGVVVDASANLLQPTTSFAEISSTDLFSTCDSLINGTDWMIEDSIFTSLEMDSFSWTNNIDNFQTESFDQSFDNFWSKPFF